MSDKLLSDKLKCYFTEEAETAITLLVEGGMDRDLAVILLEQHWPDTKVYKIETEA